MADKDFNNAAFQAYLAEHKLMGTRCQSCGALFLPPRPMCTSCYGGDMEWTEIPGEGELVAFTTIHIAPTAMLEAGFTDEQMKNATLFEPVGCPSCTKGYRGRTGIYEMMNVSAETAELIMQKATQAEIARQVRSEGCLSLKQEGIKKVAAGITSLAEVERVTKG